MRFKAPILALALSTALAVATPVFAADVGVFCIEGSGTGTNWSWKLKDGGTECENENVPGVLGTADQVRDRFVTSINNACPSTFARAEALSADVVDSNCFAGATSAFRVDSDLANAMVGYVGTAGSDAETGGGACQIGPCNFNPTIDEGTPSTPGVSEWGQIALVAMMIVAASVLILARMLRRKGSPV